MATDIPFEMTVQDLDQARQSGSALTILDVREQQEVAICRLSPSLHIPMSGIPGALDQLDRDNPLVVLCHHGVRSGQVVAWLRHNGFSNAINLQGGIDRWAQQIDPAMPTY